jgi:alpha-1,3-glucosyltransferase
LGFVTISTFAVVFSPFLYPLSSLLQALHRIFPFARGLFEDKVANAWCALNIVVKLRDMATVATLAKLALGTTLVAILPGVIGILWVSWEAGSRRRGTAPTLETDQEAAREIPPTLILLPHALFISSMAFFLFSFQVHEKSILLPLMPLTILMGGREAGFGRMDWEWAVLLNNVGLFR